jgi:hypothetical protein
MATTKKPRKKKEVIAGIKGFDKDLKCRGYQFEIGKTFKHDGEVKACNSGFHSFEYPLDVFNYYAPADSRFCEIKASGEISRHADDSKIASAEIKIVAELKIPELITRAIKWITAQTEPSQLIHETGYQSAASNTGYRSAASNTGDQSAASNTGDQSAASNTGYRSAASNTGDQSAASNTGYQSAASNTGYQSAASVEGKASVAMASGYEGRAKACLGSAIFLVHRDGYKNDYAITHVFASLAGENGIKPDVYYMLDKNGKPVEVS